MPPTIILPDQETKVDLLNYEAIAATIVGLVVDRPDVPLTVGVHGDWGAGKSSLLEMVEHSLAEKHGVLCIKFNGWRFQGFEDAKIVLLEGLVGELVAKQTLVSKTSEKVKELFRRIDWLKVAKKGAGYAWNTFSGLPTPDQVKAITDILSRLRSDPSQFTTKDNMETALHEVTSILKPAEPKHVPEEVEEFRKEFDSLLKEAGVDRLVVLVDDLDRCLPDTAIETLEAIRLFVFTSRTAFIIAADEAMIEYAVRRHFPNLPESTVPVTYSRNYLEKLIQIPFRIPALGITETRIYVTLLLIGTELGENSDQFNALIVVARELLKRPWKSQGLDAATVKKALGGNLPSRVSALLMLSDQIGPVLADGTQGNPRQIKRFLNTLLLRRRIAEERGLGADIQIPVLSKLMLAERFQPKLFGQIARDVSRSATGICEGLAALEAAVEATDLGAKKLVQERGPTSAPEKADESPHLQEWLTLDSVRAWAAIDPKLASEDLRPYLFVTKDRRGYISGLSSLGHLEEVAKRLLGPPIGHPSTEELKRLAPSELKQLFGVLREKIAAQGKFDTEPDGMGGLKALVRAHSPLQGEMLDFLSGLPSEHLGAWAAGGWRDVFREGDAPARFQQLLTTWSEEAANKPLSTAAKVARRGRTKPG